MVTVAKLSADLTANTTNFETGMRRADKTMLNTQKIFNNAIGSIGANFKALAVTAAGFFAFQKIKSDITAVINYLDDMGDSAARVGISSEAFSKLAYAAKNAEVPVESLESAIFKMQRALVEASGDPASKTAKFLELIGLNAKQLREVGADEALAQIADGLNKIQDSSLKTTASVALFGKGAAGVADLLNKGGDAIRAYGKDAENLGIVVTEQASARAEEFKESMVRIEAAYQGMIIRLTEKGVLDVGIKGIEDFVVALTGFITKLDLAAQEWRKFTGTLDKNNLSDLNYMIDEQLEKTQQTQKNEYLPGLTEAVFGTTMAENETRKLEELIRQKDKLVQKEMEQKKIADERAAVTAKQTEEDKKAAQAKADQLAKERAFTLESDKKSEKSASLIGGLREESEQLKLQVDLYGQKEGAQARARRELEIENQLREAGITLSKDQQAQIESYLDEIERQKDAYQELEEQSKKLADQERDRQQAITQYGYAFESAFEDAIVSGKKLSEVLESLLDDIFRLAVRQQITQPLVSSIFGGGTGGGAGLFSSLASYLPSFDVGTSFVPQDMVANIHRGERILTASENKAYSRGGGGVIVNVQNNSSAGVSTSSSQSSNGTDINVLIDEAVARNIGNPSSATNRSLNSLRGRTLTRR